MWKMKNIHLDSCSGDSQESSWRRQRGVGMCRAAPAAAAAVPEERRGLHKALLRDTKDTKPLPSSSGSSPAQAGRSCCSDRGLALGVGLGWVHLKTFGHESRTRGLWGAEGTVAAFPLPWERSWGL